MHLQLTMASDRWMGINHGESSPQNLEWANTNANYPPRLCHVSQFQGSVHLQPPLIGTKPSPQEENSTFFGWKHKQKLLLTIHQNMPFQVKIFFSGEGDRPIRDPPSVAMVALPHPNPPPCQAFGIQPFTHRIPSRSCHWRDPQLQCQRPTFKIPMTSHNTMKINKCNSSLPMSSLSPCFQLTAALWK